LLGLGGTVALGGLVIPVVWDDHARKLGWNMVIRAEA
jgi:hypothetical protein